MKNYIEKSVALDNLRIVKEQAPADLHEIIDVCTAAIDIIEVEDLQPVTYGEWIDITDEEINLIGYKGKTRPCKCSLCGQWYVGSDEFETFCNFCSSCGADMRGNSE